MYVNNACESYIRSVDDLGDIQQIKYIYQTYNGIRCAKLVPVNRFNVPYHEQDLKMSYNAYLIPATITVLSEKMKIESFWEDAKLVPLFETLKQHPYHPKVGIVQTRLLNDDDTPHRFCPRYLLEKALEDLRQLGYTLKVGFEVEFQICYKDKLDPVETNEYSNSNSLDEYLEDLVIILENLKKLGVETELAHKESAEGQYEIVLKYCEIFKALEDLDLSREIITNHFRKKGLRAVFLPRLHRMGNGCHVHLSLWNGKTNVTGDMTVKDGLSDVCKQFIAGIYQHFGALVHFLAPSILSFNRIQPSSFVGAYKIWGQNNKEAPIRICNRTREDQPITNFEIKTLDHTANPSLALAAVVSLGVFGIKNRLILSEPCRVDPVTLNEKELLKHQIERLPLTLEERRKAIFSDEGFPLRQFFGEDLPHNLLSLSELDQEHTQNMEPQQIINLLINQY